MQKYFVYSQRGSFIETKIVQYIKLLFFLWLGLTRSNVPLRIQKLFNFQNFLYSLHEINFLLELDRKNHKDEIVNLIQRTFHEWYYKNPDRFAYQTCTKKNQSQNTIIKFIKTLVKFIGENHTGEITFARLVADERNEIQHY